MKKILLFLLALAAILPASADCYLTFGVNDTIRIRPSDVDGKQFVTVRGHFDGRLDKWDMSLTFPLDITLTDYSMRNDMLSIPYYNYLGVLSYCSAQLLFDDNLDLVNLNHLDSLSASIIVPGYWDPNNDGIYETYGTVKWEAGDYSQICELAFKHDTCFPDTMSVFVREHFSSTMDLRGYTIPNTYISKRIFFYVGYMIGDVDGNEVVNISDMSMLTDYILHDVELDQYQLKAADVDGNGIVNIADATALGDLILS